MNKKGNSKFSYKALWNLTLVTYFIDLLFVTEVVNVPITKQSC